MELYILPSVVAISAKIVLFLVGRKVIGNIDKSLLGFLVSLCFVNIFELTLMLSLPHPSGSFVLLVMYYNSALLAIAFFLYYTLKLRGLASQRLWRIIAAFSAVAIGCASIPGMAITGAESIGYSITRIPGPFYPVLQVTILAGTLIGFLQLLAARKSEDILARRKALVLLVALLPLMVSVIFIIIAMQFGLHMNATIIVSIETSFMMAVLFYVESQHRMFKVLSLIPSTDEHKQWNEISGLLNDHDVSLKEAQLRFTELFVQDAMRRAKGSQVKAAQLLGTSRSTVYRYLPEHQRKSEAE